MNDMVSIRKIRPLPSAKGAGVPGAVLTGGDFFLGGNWPSLAVVEGRTTGDTEEHWGKRIIGNNLDIRFSGNSSVFFVVKNLGNRV
jgi:hypothetical protein